MRKDKTSKNTLVELQNTGFSPPFSLYFALVTVKTMQKSFVPLYFAAHATHLNGAHFISSNPFCMLSNPFYMFSTPFFYIFNPFYLHILFPFWKHPSLFMACDACLRGDNETSWFVKAFQLFQFQFVF